MEWVFPIFLSPMFLPKRLVLDLAGKDARRERSVDKTRSRGSGCRVTKTQIKIPRDWAKADWREHSIPVGLVAWG